MTAAEEEKELCVFLRQWRRARAGSMPVSVEMDQLLCLPEPLTPAKGFSCSRQTRPWRCATFFIISMVSWLWSVAMFVVVKIGASSCCAGCDLVVLGLGKHAELPQLFVQLLHERGNPGLDCAEVVIFQLLALGRLGAEQRAARVDEVRALVVKRLYRQGNIPAPGRRWCMTRLVVVSPNRRRMRTAWRLDRFHGAQQRGLSYPAPRRRRNRTP